jgi:hypothetical protein
VSETANLGPAEPIRETDKALLVRLDSDGEEHWMPKSVIDDDSECYSMKSGAGDLIVAAWFAAREGLR